MKLYTLLAFTLRPIKPNTKTMTTTIIILTTLLAIILITAAWNGHVIRWEQTGIKLHSRTWHGLGLSIRGLLCVLGYIEAGWVMAALLAFVSWIPYNIIINLIIGQKWYYIGKTSVIDKFIRRLFKKP